jgi:hypothetical protein
MCDNARRTICLFQQVTHSSTSSSSNDSGSSSKDLCMTLIQTSVLGYVVLRCRLPQRCVLTLNLELPESWLVEPVMALHDFDNLRLADVHEQVRAGTLCPREYTGCERGCTTC